LLAFAFFSLSVVSSFMLLPEIVASCERIIVPRMIFVPGMVSDFVDVELNFLKTTNLLSFSHRVFSVRSSGRFHEGIFQ
jgi:hypothetical protein